MAPIEIRINGAYRNKNSWAIKLRNRPICQVNRYCRGLKKPAKHNSICKNVRKKKVPATELNRKIKYGKLGTSKLRTGGEVL